MSAPTYEDANVMLQLARWGAEIGLGDASRFVNSDAYIEDYEAFKQKYPRGTEERRYVDRYLYWFESMAALWLNGLFHEKLIKDWITVHQAWARVEKYALGVREEFGDPTVLANFEALAKAIAG